MTHGIGGNMVESRAPPANDQNTSDLRGTGFAHSQDIPGEARHTTLTLAGPAHTHTAPIRHPKCTRSAGGQMWQTELTRGSRT